MISWEYVIEAGWDQGLVELSLGWHHRESSIEGFNHKKTNRAMVKSLDSEKILDSISTKSHLILWSERQSISVSWSQMRGLLPPAEAGGGCVGLQSGAHRGRVRFLCNFYSVLWNFSHGSEMRGEIWILIEKLLKCRGNTDNWDLGRILEDLERFWK